MSQEKSSYLTPSVRRVLSNSMITLLGRTIIVFYLKGQHIQQFKQLDINLHDYIQSHSLNIKEIQSIFKQVTTSLMFMHSLGITHTDLKPENIVFANQQKYPDQLNDQEIQLNQQTWEVPLKPMNIIVQAPEVIMRCDTWDTSSDIWSLACLIVELYTGNNDLMHLAIIQSIFGPIPQYMKQRSKFKTRFNSLPKAQPQKQLHQIIDDQDLLDLLNMMFQIDHHHRINCKQILEHKFFQKLFSNF
ncbi:unnamed protein product [Paramecium pentaurelia]|uniref:Protein kinase domain-containing protein n=2 Tax=Paramecium TaxID=5884 RepID=A0A8S1WQU5_9CILI|nr:unnamed protein product [Paramecium pentaurelia]